MACSLCSFFTCIYHYIIDLIECGLESPFVLLLIALFIAFVIMSNVQMASQLCDSKTNCSIGIGNCNSNSNKRGACNDGYESHACAFGQGEHFDYGLEHGPHTWPCAQNNQSPINIATRCASKHTLMQPLRFCNYSTMPAAVMMENNGNTLILRASYDNDTPVLSGGDLLSSYRFVELSFRWSWYDAEGSEHAIDYQHYPLEMQALHSAGASNGDASSYDLLMLSYFYELSADNPFLDAILQYLIMIQTPGSRIEVPPFPLSYLLPPFQANFYSYSGSLTEPPCHRGTEWIINPEPLAIGPRQLNEFRQLRNYNGTRIQRNARPVQPLGVGREINYNIYDSANLPECSTTSSCRSSGMSYDSTARGVGDSSCNSASSP